MQKRLYLVRISARNARLFLVSKSSISNCFLKI
nr:MAG TPA: hypothetical protein [Caudoviricetes sp.]